MTIKTKSQKDKHWSILRYTYYTQKTNRIGGVMVSMLA